MNRPDAQPVADPSQNRVRGSGNLLVDLSHPRVGLHMSQTRRTNAEAQVNGQPDADKASQEKDPAAAFPTRAARRAAYDAWDAEYLAWEAAGKPGGPDAWPRPPAGLTSACMTPRLMHGARYDRWQR